MGFLDGDHLRDQMLARRQPDGIRHAIRAHVDDKDKINRIRSSHSRARNGGRAMRASDGEASRRAVQTNDVGGRVVGTDQRQIHACRLHARGCQGDGRHRGTGATRCALTTLAFQQIDGAGSGTAVLGGGVFFVTSRLGHVGMMPRFLHMLLRGLCMGDRRRHPSSRLVVSGDASPHTCGSHPFRGQRDQ